MSDSSENLKNQWEGRGQIKGNTSSKFNQPTPANENDPEDYECYGLEESDVAIEGLLLSKRNGEDLQMPYSGSIWSRTFKRESDSQLVLKLMDFEWIVYIKGRGIRALAEYFRTGRMKWLKESKSVHDDQHGDVFIDDITFIERKAEQDQET